MFSHCVGLSSCVPVRAQMEFFFWMSDFCNGLVEGVSLHVPLAQRYDGALLFRVCRPQRFLRWFALRIAGGALFTCLDIPGIGLFCPSCSNFKSSF